MSMQYLRYTRPSICTQDDAANALYTLLCVLTNTQISGLSDELRTLARYVDYESDIFEEQVGESLLTDRDAEITHEEDAYDEYMALKE